MWQSICFGKSNYFPAGQIGRRWSIDRQKESTNGGNYGITSDRSENKEGESEK